MDSGWSLRKRCWPHGVLICPQMLGVDASHISGDGWASTNASSSHPWQKTSRLWWGGGYWRYAPKKCVSSEMSWTRDMQCSKRRYSPEFGSNHALGLLEHSLRRLSNFG
jgi:hypothetical protein